MQHGRRLRDKVYSPDEPYDRRETAGQPASNLRSISRAEAYDLARKEFYDLRQFEQIEQRVSHEEATYVGAYFNKPLLDVAMELEDEVQMRWLEWAEKELLAMESTAHGPVQQASAPVLDSLPLATSSSLPSDKSA